MLRHLTTEAFRIQTPADQGDTNGAVHGKDSGKFPKGLLSEFLATGLGHLLHDRTSVFVKPRSGGQIRTSLRTFNGDRPRHEDRTLNGGLCRRHAELKLALIELSNNLTHRRLIHIDRSSHRPGCLDRTRHWRDRRRHRDESGPSHSGAERHHHANKPC